MSDVLSVYRDKGRRGAPIVACIRSGGTIQTETVDVESVPAALDALGLDASRYDVRGESAVLASNDRSPNVCSPNGCSGGRGCACGCTRSATPADSDAGRHSATPADSPRGPLSAGVQAVYAGHAARLTPDERRVMADAVALLARIEGGAR